MKQQRKIYNFFFSTTLGAWSFVLLVVLCFVAISAVYLYWQSEFSLNFIFSKNIIKDLQPLAVIIIGLASVLIAASNYWEKIGHNITGRFIGLRPLKKNRSTMPYIASIILCNRKNKVEVIDKILFFSKKLGPTTVADFSQVPISLKNYETKTILLDPVTTWVSGISKEDIVKKTLAELVTGFTRIINTIKAGVHPKFYFTPYNSLNRDVTIPKTFAVISGVLIPIKFEDLKYELQSILPIRNTNYLVNEEPEEKAIYDPRVIMVTELTLGPTEAGKEPDNKEIKILLYSNEEKFHFDSYTDENPFHHLVGFWEISNTETKDFEKEWQKYYADAEKNYEKHLAKMEELEQNNKETPPYAETFEDEVHNQTVRLFEKRDLPRISSKIASRIFFLRDVKEFAEYPIVNKHHTLFATGFYPTEEVHPFFEEVEVKESTFAKIRKWRFRKTPRSSQETQEETNAETAKKTK